MKPYCSVFAVGAFTTVIHKKTNYFLYVYVYLWCIYTFVQSSLGRYSHCAVLWEPSPARCAQSLPGRYQGGTHEGKLCIWSSLGMSWACWAYWTGLGRHVDKPVNMSLLAKCSGCVRWHCSTMSFRHLRCWSTWLWKLLLRTSLRRDTY